MTNHRASTAVAIVRSAEASCDSRASEIAARLGLPLRLSDAERPAGELALVVGPEGISLSCDGMTAQADFRKLLRRTARGGARRELVAKACKVTSDRPAPLAIDATAGLGDDSFLLAAAGFQVRMFERDPIIAQLLQDGIERASSDPDTRETASRLSLVHADSILALGSLTESPDVVLLDPMFPERRSSAAVKKKLQLLQMLEQPCDDELGLLEAAFSAHPRKVAVKRPAKGPYLAGRKPSYSLAGKAVRFDCYVNP